MAHSDTSISIHLLKDPKNVNLDDTVRILKNLEDNAFDLIYKDKGDPLVHKVHLMSRDKVCDYVYMLLKNLTLDEDGYQSIQFSVPAMPRVLVSTSKLNDDYYRDHFLALIENSLSMIDRVEKLTIKKPSEKPPSCCDSNSADCSEPTASSNANWPELPRSPVHRYFS